MPRRSRFKIADPRCEIRPIERDRKLLSAGAWPLETEAVLREGAPGSLWEIRDGHLFRRINVHDEGNRGRRGSHSLWEALLRFPNASLYATHKQPKKPFPFEPWPNLHTMRVLGMGVDGPTEPARHVYLLHNGLNETSDLLFHYRLAAWILDKRPDAVCILRPLPGHLTRYPFDGPYATKPLDDYLRNPADLFRQFLRYMLETQWLLSALVPRSRYPVSTGTLLLGEAKPDRSGARKTGRLDDAKLASAMAKAWSRAFDSNKILDEPDKPNGGVADSAGGHSQEPVTQPMMKEVIEELRNLLQWDPVLSAVPPKAQPASGRANDPVPEPEPPCIHAVGYSMGGFVAQAAFFAWPFAISSCTNMFAGGALRDLAPTAFAHPEEWQAVLHGMRYELDRAFQDESLAPRDGLIAGIEQSVFGYLTRIFYEVFLQYYRGGYASRVSEFSRRLLFVLGGDDPIVRTKNVLDAGPPQGMTLLQIADVSHFPGRRGDGLDGGKVESEQRGYWLPEVGRVIANFSERAEVLLNRTLADSWDVYSGRAPVNARELSESPAPSGEDRDRGMLDSASFAKELAALTECVESEPSEQGMGWLIVGRNEVPPAFLETKAYLAYAQAVHHSEDEITSYINVLRERSKWLTDKKDRVTLLVPQQCEEWFKERSERERFLSKSETASSARIPDDKAAEGMWKFFEEKWLAGPVAGRVRLGEYTPASLDVLGEEEAARLKIDTLPIVSLPDVWIALSGVALRELRGQQDTRESNQSVIVDLAKELVEEWGEKASLGRTRAPSDHRDDKNGDHGLARLERWIDSGDVRAIMVSGAELNSRYRGRRLREVKDVRKAIVHWALAFSAFSLDASPNHS